MPVSEMKLIKSSPKKKTFQFVFFLDIEIFCFIFFFCHLPRAVAPLAVCPLPVVKAWYGECAKACPPLASLILNATGKNF